MKEFWQRFLIWRLLCQSVKKVGTLGQAPFQDRRYPTWRAFEREREEDSGRMFM